MFKDDGLIERTWLFQQGIEKGIEEGIERGARSMLLALLAARGLKLTAAQRRRVEETHALETIQRWGERAATAATAAAVFDDAAKKPRRPAAARR